nr:unnamed protein product [Digitaria exilis]
MADDFANPPQIGELDHLALKRKDGVSTKDCKEVWCCPGCKVLFPPRRNLLVDLPEYECPTCHQKNPTAHDWKIPDRVVNGVPLEFMDTVLCIPLSLPWTLPGGFKVQCVAYQSARHLMLIASGYPLLSGVNIGSLFQWVSNREVYITPTLEQGAASHLLALIGSGIGRNRKGELETYFIARDSAGCNAHSDYQKQGLGGDMCVWASDLYNVWGFRLDDKMQEG